MAKKIEMDKLDLDKPLSEAVVNDLNHTNLFFIFISNLIFFS